MVEERKVESRAKMEEQIKASKVVAVIGDIGGTNIRLKLIMLNLVKRTSHVLKEIVTIKSQSVDNLSSAINDFIKDCPVDQRPAVGVIGIAGSVKNNAVLSANLPKSWPNPLVGDTVG
jgi:glucokinase